MSLFDPASPCQDFSVWSTEWNSKKQKYDKFPKHSRKKVTYHEAEELCEPGDYVAFEMGDIEADVVLVCIDIDVPIPDPLNHHPIECVSHQLCGAKRVRLFTHLDRRR